MSNLEFGDSRINSLTNLNGAKPISDVPIKENEKSTVSSLQLSEKLKISHTLKGNAFTNLDLSDKKAEVLPEIEIQKDGKFTFYTNAYGKRITALQTDDGISYNTFSDQGLSIILKNNSGKRDVLVFSAMTDKVPNNSSIYDNYFYINDECSSNITFEAKGKCDSKIYFDKHHNIVIELNDKNDLPPEKLVLDGKDAKTVIEGPFKIKFNPESDGRDFNVEYTGSDKIKRFTSRGGKIKF